jgi:ring-1,2-phenylacetyl-CoA epoxidase subunit PaaD
MGVMRADLVHALHDAGFADVDVRTVLSPAWTTDWISEDGRRKLAEAGIAPPGAAPVRPAGPVPLSLGPSRRAAACPLCGSPDTVELSEFGATACKALRRCRACGEPFEHVKEI